MPTWLFLQFVGAFCGVLVINAPLLGVYTRAPDEQHPAAA